MEESNMQPPELIPRHIEEPDSGAVTYDICQPKTGASLANKISTQVKQAATQRVFDSAAQIVEEVYRFNKLNN